MTRSIKSFALSYKSAEKQKNEGANTKDSYCIEYHYRSNMHGESDIKEVKFEEVVSLL